MDADASKKKKIFLDALLRQNPPPQQDVWMASCTQSVNELLHHMS
jgi:hypothetical protein